MKVALFIPCYVDQFYPRVGIETLQLLRKLGCEVDYPKDQACCGQPMANAGYEKNSKKAHKTFRKNFDRFDYVVSPSGSCVHYVRDHYSADSRSEKSTDVAERTYELCEFLTDVLKVTSLDAHFPHRVGLHQSCHGLRGLQLGSGSETQIERPDKVGNLLNMVSGIELVDLDRSDECCGFGGTFAVTEEAVAVKMGRDRIADHVKNKAEFVTGTDMSCIMHLQGLARRRNDPLDFKHVAEILNAS